MKYLAALAVVAIGAAAVLFGLLFLVGAAGRPSRYAIGGISLALGAAVAGFGVRVYRRAQRERPDIIAAEIMMRAEQKSGELSTDDLRALLGDRFGLAPPVLAGLREAGLCRTREADGSVFYVFPDLQPRLTVRRCQFCEAELPLNEGEEVVTCPQCGGRVETGKVRLGVSEGAFYSLDE